MKAGAKKHVLADPFMKYCYACESELPRTTEFFSRDGSRSDGLNHKCLSCSATRLRQYLAANPARRKGYHLKDTYGIGLDVYNALLEAQGGVCAICQRPPTTRMLHVDHDHGHCPAKGGCPECIRGLLCHHCNAALGMIQDDPAVLRSAIAYLERAACRIS